MIECRSCNQHLTEDNFFKAAKKTYYDKICKGCKQQLQQNRKRAQKAKCVAHMGGKCERCGLEDHPVVYDFHHRDPSKKLFEINSSLKAWDRLVEEMKKCNLLCAVCHRTIEFTKEAQWFDNL